MAMGGRGTVRSDEPCQEFGTMSAAITWSPMAASVLLVRTGFRQRSSSASSALVIRFSVDVDPEPPFDVAVALN